MPHTHLGDALKAASRLSRRDGRLRFSYATAHGFQVTLRRPNGDCYWTNGQACGCWHAGEHEGRWDPVLSQHVLGNLAVVPAEGRA